MKRKNKGNIKLIVLTAALLIGAAVSVVLLLENLASKDGHFTPDYGKVDLDQLMEHGISKEEYEVLFLQTGLGQGAIDQIMANSPNFMKELEKHQKNFFEENNYEVNRITVITGEEQSVDEEGKGISRFEIQDMEDGDIFISLSTHSLGWRHGHAAIVVDGEKGITLESVVLGRDSEIQHYQKWERYPAFIQLRLNEEGKKVLGELGQSVGKAATQKALEKLDGIPYGLLTGLPGKYSKDIKKTQCAHLVWYAYKELGIDLDSDGGWLVTPYDIANSELLQVVQIYGVNPADYL